MRLMLLARALVPGGTERQLVLLANGLAERGHQVHLVLWYPDGALHADLAAGVQVTCLGSGGRWHGARVARRWLHTRRHWRPDVVYSVGTPSHLLSLLRWPAHASRLVWGIRSAGMDLRPYGRLPRVLAGIAARASRYTDAVVYNAAAGRDYHQRQGYPERDAHVVHNGILVPGDAPRPVRDGPGVVGLVARLDPVKRHGLALQAMAGLQHHCPGARLMVLGDGPPQQLVALQDQAAALGLARLVQFVDGITDPAALYRDLDVLLLPSASEGFPNVLAEALARGVPCVATDTGAAAEIVNGHGRVLPPQCTADELAAALAAVLGDRDLRARVARTAPGDMLERFGVPRMLAAMEAILDPATAGSDPEAPCTSSM